MNVKSLIKESVSEFKETTPTINNVEDLSNLYYLIRSIISEFVDEEINIYLSIEELNLLVMGQSIKSKYSFEIKLNSKMIDYAEFNSWLDTILHEFAHALTNNSGHNKKWRDMCKYLGCNTSAKSKSVLPFNYYKDNFKYSTICPICNIESFYNKKVKTYCGNCLKEGITVELECLLNK